MHNTYFVAKVKEKEMAKRNFWMGMLVMTLVFGILFVGVKPIRVLTTGNGIGLTCLAHIPDPQQSQN